MPKRKPPEDLDKYRPDEATADAVMNDPIDPVDYARRVDPKLIARLEELNRQSANPGPAPPSVTAYVPPTPLAEASQDRTTLPRAVPKVELAVPPSRSESPTEPSLKRLEGEPEVPGVVKGPSAYAPKERRAAATKGGQRIPKRTAVLATLAFASAALVLVAMARIVRQAAPSEAASARMAMEPAAPVPSVAATVATAALPSAAPVTSAPAPSAPSSASAVPSASASAEPASPPAVGPHKTKPHATADDPYGDGAMPSPRKTAEPAPLPPPTPPPSSAPSAAAVVPQATAPVPKPSSNRPPPVPTSGPILGPILGGSE